MNIRGNGKKLFSKNFIFNDAIQTLNEQGNIRVYNLISTAIPINEKGVHPNSYDICEFLTSTFKYYTNKKLLKFIKCRYDKIVLSIKMKISKKFNFDSLEKVFVNHFFMLKFFTFSTFRNDYINSDGNVSSLYDTLSFRVSLDLK